MQSFYGGRQGISFILKKSFDSVESMNAHFARGAETTSEVGYGEYVVINTAYTRDKTNGQVYIRGFNGAEGPICTLMGPEGNVPAIEMYTEGHVSDYIDSNDANFKANYPETWKRGKGQWGASEGIETTVYRLKADPDVIISSSDYEALTEYGKQNYEERRTLKYIKIIRYYLNITDSTNVITKDQYKRLSDADKALYSPCYINKENPDTRITETTYNTLSNLKKSYYREYWESDQNVTHMILETAYDALPAADKVDYEECYTDKIHGTTFICLTEYNALESIDKLDYTPNFYVDYVRIDDNTQVIDYYTYSHLSEIGQVDYSAYTYYQNKGLRAPSETSDSYIYYAYANKLDEYGNVSSCLIGFSFPYYKDKFFSRSIEPYNAEGDILTSNDVLPANIHNDKDFNYYKEWTLDIPKGVKGNSINRVFVAPDYAPVGSVITNAANQISTDEILFTRFSFDESGNVTHGIGLHLGSNAKIALSDPKLDGLKTYYWMEIVDYSTKRDGVKTYQKIGEYQTIRKVAIADSNGDDYKIYDLLILYNDASHLGNITYKGETGWVNVGNVRGKIQGLRVFAVYDTYATFDTAAHITSGNPLNPVELAEAEGVEDPDNCAGWGVMVLNPTAAGEDETASLYFFDYVQNKWKKISNNAGVGSGGDPESIVYIGDEDCEDEAEDLLSEGGVWLMTEVIHRVY